MDESLPGSQDVLLWPRRCPRCQNLCLADITGSGYVLHSDVKGLFRAARVGREGGCDLCSSILWSLRANAPRLYSMDGCGVVLYQNPPESTPVQRIDVIVVDEAKRQDLLWCSDVAGLWHLGPPDEKPWLARGHLTLYTSHKHNDFESTVSLKYRMTEANSGSIPCFNLITKWLSDCQSNHGKNCPANDNSPLPARVIDIGPPDGSESPRLVVTTEGQCGNYMALSYCWGRTPFLNLTTANKKELEKQIPFDKLPQTIRDAIAVTRRLGIRYVWIDSLCIIQGRDDEALKDWEREVQHMNTVFRGAFLVVMATGADDAYQGLFTDRAYATPPSCKLRIDRDSSAIAYLGRDPEEELLSNEPLNKRGWAYQEAFLSIRAVIYGSKELSWKCRAAHYRESLEANALARPVIRRLGEPHHIRTNWKTIVEEYSSRNLTFIADKLPAIAGLAKLGQVDSPTGYAFGVWIDQLVELLLWRHLGHVVDGRHQYSRQAKHRAPSWSWASVDGRIKFLPGTDPKYLQIERFKDDGTIAIQGPVQRIQTMRLAYAANYYGGYDNYLPWAKFPSTMKTFIDDINTIPARHRKMVANRCPELLGVWFLFLGPGCGLILAEDGWAGRMIQPSTGCLAFSLQKKRKFVRLGSFEGYSNENHCIGRLLLR